ncbi:LOW QUALITY PROTEIN: hypothetical protein ColTof3_14771 [Colletotrichum tofieldiae]|nr:LOW QUALITY PROTEIN: hypothetical protein ColTof3_14771 [Colletotrichum tofieldiae]
MDQDTPADRTSDSRAEQGQKRKRTATKVYGLPDVADEAYQTGQLFLTTDVLCRMTRAGPVASVSFVARPKLSHDARRHSPRPPPFAPFSTMPPASFVEQGATTTSTDAAAKTPAPETATVLISSSPGHKLAEQTLETSRACAIETFNARTWLSDEVINQVMAYLVSRNEAYGFVSSLSFSAIVNSANPPGWAPPRFAGLKGTKDTILFPVHTGQHWVLAQYSFDGAARWAIWGPDTPCISQIAESAEQQPNSYDCGLYVLYHADMLTRGPNDPVPEKLSSAALRYHYRQVFMTA